MSAARVSGRPVAVDRRTEAVGSGDGRRHDPGGAIVRTEPLGGGALTAAALAGTTPEGWYPPRPRSPAAWADRIAAVRAGAGPRPVAWLDELWPAIAPAGAARERLERAAERGVVVTTGQQPGLFGGPIYTWSKAIGVLAFADALQRATGVPVAPLFWAATDDADFAEASTTWIAVPGGVEPLTVMPVAPQGTVLAAAPLGELTQPLSRLIDAAGSAPYGAALDAVRAAYPTSAGRVDAVGVGVRRQVHGAAASPGTTTGPTAGPTAGAAFVALLRGLLEPLGIGVLDASHPAVRRRAYPVLVRALQRADAVAAALENRTQAIHEAGYSPQVSNVPGLSLVFAWQGDVAERGDGGREASKSRIPVAESAAVARNAQPGDLTHNVLLRPIVERAIVPTAAYLGGPSEIAYFAQTSAVAAALDVAPPLALPRWACTLIEPSAAALLARYGLAVDAFRDPHAAEGRVARAALPAALREALAELGDAVERATRAIAAADSAGLVPGAVIDGARGQLRHRVARLERRYVAAAKRTEHQAMHDLATLRGVLYPNGARQERALNFIPFLARGGPALLDAMRAAAGEHAAALVGGGASQHR